MERLRNSTLNDSGDWGLENPDVGASSTFRYVFVAVAVLSVLSLGLAFLLADLTEPTRAQEQLLETCSTCWKMGFGAIVGMIGGKAV